MEDVCLSASFSKLRLFNFCLELDQFKELMGGDFTSIRPWLSVENMTRIWRLDPLIRTSNKITSVTKLIIIIIIIGWNYWKCLMWLNIFIKQPERWYSEYWRFKLWIQISSLLMKSTWLLKKLGHVFFSPRINVKIDTVEVQSNAYMLRLPFLAVLR